jgi:hypothetical protein
LQRFARKDAGLDWMSGLGKSTSNSGDLSAVNQIVTGIEAKHVLDCFGTMKLLDREAGNLICQSNR